MATEQTFLANIDELDKEQYNQNLRNIHYVGKNSKNTILHLMGMATFNFDSYKPRIIKILADKSIDVNRLNNRMRTCIIEAMKFQNYDFAKLVIEKSNIDLSIKDDRNVDAFDFACSRNQPDIANMIFERVKNVGISYLSGILDPNERSKLELKIYMESNGSKIPYSTDDPVFKIYHENEFIIKSGDAKGKGSYGIVNIVTEKSTGKIFVIKRFKANIDKKFLTDDIIKDVCFLKTLNKYGTAVKVYGMMYDSKGYIYMVMESLEENLSMKLRLIYKLGKNLREIAFLELLKEILICIDINCKIGIIHCDTKENNIMTDDERRTRYIDYGFSYFLGISPYSYNINKEIHHGSYLSSDGDSCMSTLVDYYDYHDIKKKLFTIKKGYTGFNLDIPSVAYMFISQTFHKSDDLYGVHNDVIYTNISHIVGTNDFSVNSTNSDKIKNNMLNTFGVTLTNLLMKMMEIDPNNRPTAKEILNSSYFNMEELIIPKNIELLSFRFPMTGSVSSKIIYSMAKRYNTISSEQYLRGGFVYYDDIYDHWKDVEVTLFRGLPELTSIFARALTFANTHYLSFDTFYSSIYYFYKFRPNTVKDMYLKFLYIMMCYSQLYEDSGFDQDDLIRECMSYNKISKTQALNFCEEMFNIVKKDVMFFNLRPTMIFVGYIKFILMSTCNHSVIIGDIMGRFHVALYEFITRQSGEDLTMKISDIVKKVYDDLPDNIPFKINEQSDYKIENGYVYYSS